MYAAGTDTVCAETSTCYTMQANKNNCPNGWETEISWTLSTSGGTFTPSMTACDKYEVCFDGSGAVDTTSSNGPTYVTCSGGGGGSGSGYYGSGSGYYGSGTGYTSGSGYYGSGSGYYGSGSGYYGSGSGSGSGGYGSCVGDCNGNGGGCWCDSVCTSYGDCCSDFATACPNVGTGNYNNYGSGSS